MSLYKRHVKLYKRSLRYLSMVEFNNSSRELSADLTTIQDNMIKTEWLLYRINELNAIPKREPCDQLTTNMLGYMIMELMQEVDELESQTRSKRRAISRRLHRIRKEGLERATQRGQPAEFDIEQLLDTFDDAAAPMVHVSAREVLPSEPLRAIGERATRNNNLSNRGRTVDDILKRLCLWMRRGIPVVVDMQDSVFDAAEQGEMIAVSHVLYGRRRPRPLRP